MSDDQLSSYVADSPYQPLGFVCLSCFSGWAFPGVFYLNSESLGLQLGEDIIRNFLKKGMDLFVL